MEMRETLITPATATTWLEGNTHNRPVRDATVKRYARDMKAGRWQLTHQGIAFGPEGELLDGQHRLWAIVTAETAVRMMVARGVSPGVQAVIDDNMPRSAGDGLKLQYDTPTRAVEVAVAKWLASDQVRSRPSRQEVIETFLAHREAIGFASRSFPRMLRGVTIAAVLTVLARAWYSQDRDKLARFAEILATGRLHSEAEDVALMLRNWLIEGGTTRYQLGRDQAIYGKTERALSAFLVGQKLGLLYAASAELFPLPSPVAPVPVAPIKAKGKPVGPRVNGHAVVRLRR
jgi:hypothetical protein